MTEVAPQGGSVVATATTTAIALPLTLPQNFPLALAQPQEAVLTERLNKFNFEALTLQDITTLGLESEVALSQTLDGFLARIDKQSAPQMFQLMSKLDTDINQADLPNLADRIMNGKPSLLVRALGLVYPKALKKAVARMHEDIARVASGKSKSLADVVGGMEATLRLEMNNLGDELRHLDTVKESYRVGFVAFAQDTVFLHNALSKAQAQFAAAEPELMKDHLRYAEAKDKLQALESRALAIEGTMSRLPADQLVIRQLQNAGVSTLQELATTMSSRFTSIKMTLLTIHGALKVKDVQRLGEQGAALDRNLSAVRGTLMTDVVTTSANAPGKNRMQQANELKQIVADTRALNEIVETARGKNAQEFQAARTLMANARKEMTSLGKTLNPAATVGARTY